MGSVKVDAKMLTEIIISFNFEIQIYSEDQLLKNIEAHFDDGCYYVEVKNQILNNKNQLVNVEPAGYKRVKLVLRSLILLGVISKHDLDKNVWIFNKEKTMITKEELINARIL